MKPIEKSDGADVDRNRSQTTCRHFFATASGYHWVCKESWKIHDQRASFDFGHWQFRRHRPGNRQTARPSRRRCHRSRTQCRSRPRRSKSRRSRLGGRPSQHLSSVICRRWLEPKLARRAWLPRRLFRASLSTTPGILQKTPAVSEDGIELTMAVNHFGHFALTMALLADPRCQLRRIISVSSIAQPRPHRTRRHHAAQAPLRRLCDVRGVQARPCCLPSNWPSVCAAKWLSMHPSGRGLDEASPGRIRHGRADSVADGAATSVMLALDPAYENISGQYFAARRPAAMNPVAHDRAFCRAFFDAAQQVVSDAKTKRATSFLIALCHLVRMGSRSPTVRRALGGTGSAPLARSRRCERLRIQMVGRRGPGRSLGIAPSRDGCRGQSATGAPVGRRRAIEGAVRPGGSGGDSAPRAKRHASPGSERPST